tara:strand:+ start:401 stop:793 length:393 start_codon:yes stop_codon:yes gene_type:complete
MKVKQVMLSQNQFPVVLEKTILKEALEEMDKYGLGIVCIVNDNYKLIGIITDGDIRRKLLKFQKPFSAFYIDNAIDHCINDPLICYSNDSLKKAIDLMGKNEVWDLPVVDKNKNLIGLLHLHQAISKILI